MVRFFTRISKGALLKKTIIDAEILKKEEQEFAVHVITLLTFTTHYAGLVKRIKGIPNANIRKIPRNFNNPKRIN